MTQAPSIKEALELKPCPFCGCEDIKFNHPNKEVGWRGSINCPACLVTMPRECGDHELIDCWNERTALATLQPSGGRREAIARILADPKHQDRARYVQGFLYGDDHVIRDVALRENQELFRTKDEHEYEQRLEIEKAKFAAGAILASGLVQNEAGWRDISTAPKDGTPFLAWESKDRGPFKCWWHNRWPEPEAYWMDYNDSEPNPTHWKPFSAPIAIRSARDGGEG